MPVSYAPLFVPLLLIGIPLVYLLKSRKKALLAAIGSLLTVAAILLLVFVPGWGLHHQASAGNAAAQYRYAQWLENHGERLGALLPWAGEPDVYGGYAWLQKSAAQNYPPAVWLLGVRLKYGIFVPQPPNWTGPAGNVFPQPAQGQAMIDKAVNTLGYKPPTADEEGYYFQYYRRGVSP